MKKTYTIIILIILISFIVGLYYYSKMPDQLASHWNTKGEVDGYMSKFWSLFLMPIVSLVMFLLLVFVPKIDPLKKNIEKFRKYFDTFIVLMVLFLFYVYILTIAWNIGKRFDMGQAMIPAMGILFYYIGILVGHAERNWFIGIRNPWTLSSDKVWEKTHKVGGKLFKGVGIVALLGMFFPSSIIYFVLVPVIFVSVYLVIYSYFTYKKLE